MTDHKRPKKEPAIDTIKFQSKMIETLQARCEDLNGKFVGANTAKLMMERDKNTAETAMRNANSKLEYYTTQNANLRGYIDRVRDAEGKSRLFDTETSMQVNWGGQ